MVWGYFAVSGPEQCAKNPKGESVGALKLDTSRSTSETLKKKKSM